MIVPTLPPESPVDSSGNWSPSGMSLMAQLVQELQRCISEEGFIIPSQSADNMAIIQQGAAIGTLLFNTSAVNGGSIDAPNGQLYIKLADGIFHPVTNT